MQEKPPKIIIAYDFCIELKNVVKDECIVCTGDGPLHVNDVNALLMIAESNVEIVFSPQRFSPWKELLYSGRKIHDNIDPAIEFVGSLDYVVIGESNFDKYFLEFCLEFGGEGLEFIAQDDFLELLISLHFDEYVVGDPRLVQHAGLAFLHTLGFMYPDTDIAFSKRRVASGRDLSHLANRSFIGLMGYSTTKAETARHYILVRALQEYGLEKVVFHLARLTTWEKNKPETPAYKRRLDAIKIWESDLLWLKREYYDGSRYSFIWPST